MPLAVPMASERTRFCIYYMDKADWDYPRRLTEKFNWAKDKKAGLQLRDVPKPD